VDGFGSSTHVPSSLSNGPSAATPMEAANSLALHCWSATLIFCSFAQCLASSAENHSATG